MKFSVFCPTTSDRFQKFDDFAGDVDDSVHAPVNYHAYAACQAGSFHNKIATIGGDEWVLFLLSGNHTGANLKQIKKLKALGIPVLGAFKETGLQQILPQITRPRTVKILMDIFRLLDGCISPTQALVSIYRSLTTTPVEFIPTPYPVNDPRWDFSVPIEKRRGIFIGTREFFAFGRNHLFALLLLKRILEETGEFATFINTDGFTGNRLIDALGFSKDQLRVIQGKQPYSRYLREMAKHKIVFQLDQSTIPGQVAGDAILCRLPCVGGNGAIESIVFPELSSFDSDYEKSSKMAIKLCKEVNLQEHFIDDSQKRARECISFESVAKKMKLFLNSLPVFEKKGRNEKS